MQDDVNSPKGVPILSVEGVTKTFPGVKALDNVQFDLYGGSVHALVGENGAGKSTLMKIMGGIYQADTGTVKVDGKPVQIKGPLDAQDKGITVIHQEFNLMPDLTVAQNIYFGREPKTLGGLMLDDTKLYRDTAELLERLRVRINPRIKVGLLTVASMQMVEIAKALSFNSNVLIMDEPTAALTETEVETLFGVVDRFINERTGVIYVSHRMEEIKKIADTITVLRDGTYVSTDPAKDLSIDNIIEKMVGRTIETDIRPEPTTTKREVVLKVENFNTSLLKDVSFELHRGEILGFSGLMGAGRTETARALVGADPLKTGTITIEGEEVKIHTPADAVQKGIGYLSEDRKRYGLLLDNNVVKNVALASLPLWSNKFTVVNDSKASKIAQAYKDSLRIKTPSIYQKTKNLSGGNQQKVVLAKWLARDCDILIFDEPTRGIDIGAKDEIYSLLTELKEAGKSIIVISSEIPEVLRLSERIIVMCDGRITGELSNEEATQESIMAYATQFETQLSKEPA